MARSRPTTFKIFCLEPRRVPTYEDDENLVGNAVRDVSDQLPELTVPDQEMIFFIQRIVNLTGTCSSNTTLYLKVLTAVRDLCDIKSLRNELIATGICEALDTALRARITHGCFEEYYRNFRFLELLDKVKGAEDIWRHVFEYYFVNGKINLQIAQLESGVIRKLANHRYRKLANLRYEYPAYQKTALDIFPKLLSKYRKDEEVLDEICCSIFCFKVSFEVDLKENAAYLPPFCGTIFAILNHRAIDRGLRYTCYSYIYCYGNNEDFKVELVAAGVNKDLVHLLTSLVRTSTRVIAHLSDAEDEGVLHDLIALGCDGILKKFYRIDHRLSVPYGSSRIDTYIYGHYKEYT